MSLAQLGAALGSLMGGPLSDSYGRKKTIMVADVLFSLGAVIMGIAPTIAILIIGRFVVGVSHFLLSDSIIAWRRHWRNGRSFLSGRGFPCRNKRHGYCLQCALHHIGIVHFLPCVHCPRR